MSQSKIAGLWPDDSFASGLAFVSQQTAELELNAQAMEIQYVKMTANYGLGKSILWISAGAAATSAVMGAIYGLIYWWKYGRKTPPETQENAEEAAISGTDAVKDIKKEAIEIKSGAWLGPMVLLNIPILLGS